MVGEEKKKAGRKEGRKEGRVEEAWHIEGGGGGGGEVK